jgi:hypothetical protein
MQGSLPGCLCSRGFDIHMEAEIFSAYKTLGIKAYSKYRYSMI